MSSLIGTCFVTLPSATSASNAQTKLTLFSSAACALAVPDSLGTVRLKTTIAQIHTTHRHRCIVSSPTKGVLPTTFWYLATKVYIMFEAGIRESKLSLAESTGNI